MVRFNASNRQDLQVPSNLDASGARDVTPSPVYSAHDVLTVLGFSQSVRLWTEDANQDVFWELGWDLDKVSEVIQEAVKGGRLISSEWCEQEPDGPCAPCDAYEVLRAKSPKKVYVKFAIARSGMEILVISCHKSKPRKK